MRSVHRRQRRSPALNPHLLVLGAVLGLIVACAPATPPAQPTAAPAKPTTAPAAQPTAAPAKPAEAAKPTAAPAAAKPAEAAKPAVATTETLLFGMQTSLSGPLAGWGQAEERTAKLWMKMVNEKGGIKVGDKTYKIDLRVYDSKGDPEQNVPLTERLITQDKVQFLFGPVSSRHVVNACPVNEKYQIPSLNTFAFFDSVYEKGLKYCFSAQPPTSLQYDAVAALFKSKGLSNIVAIQLNDEAGETFSKEFGAALDKQGLKVSHTESYPRTTTNFSTALSKVASLNPDVIAFEGTIDLAVLFRKQQVAQGIKAKLTYMETGPNVSGWEASGEAGQGVMAQTAWTPTVVGYTPDAEAFWGTNADFVKAYQAEYGKVPEWADAVTAVSCDVYLRALTKAGTIDPVKVRDAIMSLRGANFYGPIQFDDRGMNVGPAASVYVVQDLGGGNIKVVYPESAAEAPMLFPAP